MELVLTSSYPAPVDQLLTCGKTHTLSPDEWPNYQEMGIGPEHIPDLIRLAIDEQLNTSEADCAEIWAPHHASRALAQLHAEEAIEPLIANLEMLQESSDFLSEELPTIFSMLGPTALPKLGQFIANSFYDLWARVCAVIAIEKMGLAWSEHRSECVTLLITQLEHFEENDYDLNAFLIEALVNLQAVEAAPLIERAFAADRVDESLMGDWDDIQVELGLKSKGEVEEKHARKREERSKRYGRAATSIDDEETSSSIEYASASSQIYYKTSHKTDAATRKKAKNKMAKQSRKKNRKR